MTGKTNYNELKKKTRISLNSTFQETYHRRILMHFGDGKSTPCLDVLPRQEKGCSDLSTSAFIHLMILAEKPNLIVFTGDNIFGFDATDVAKSLNVAFAPAIASNIPFSKCLFTLAITHSLLESLKWIG
ncbi:probable inactive purple acid phosphatase 29 [Humulus lupulus]|uniref:probable inactive purple acid phosphatase 29 n=1 Tax=Humulus lupulus TaxID=3486 RepID=UPI002B40AA04|nr:probable inactive purple acid phosphatase 29 [Humulus lupulus]